MPTGQATETKRDAMAADNASASASATKQKQPASPAGGTPTPTPTSHFASHGRGGAGNMANAAQSPKLKPSDLETPVLKKPVVTTGRGGTGNMAKNKDPIETRLRQDVEGVPRRSSTGAQHAGRGGAGNVFKGSDEDLELARKQSHEQAIDESPGPETLAAKGKHWFFGKKA